MPSIVSNCHRSKLPICTSVRESPVTVEENGDLQRRQGRRDPEESIFRDDIKIAGEWKEPPEMKSGSGIGGGGNCRRRNQASAEEIADRGIDQIQTGIVIKLSDRSNRRKRIEVSNQPHTNNTHTPFFDPFADGGHVPVKMEAVN
ncbi:hypothetical protein LXL04_014441 [Taraxacum kok-saghyz]